MLKPSLQLKLGQQLTMTPQLQQAIRLLQLPALELQAHIRELLETNVMLEPEEEENPGALEPASPEAPARSEERAGVEVVEDEWEGQSSGPAEPYWGGDEEDRQQDFADASGQSLQEYLLWQLELARLDPRELAIARAVVDAINDDGYLTEPLEEIADTLKPDLQCDPMEI